MDLNDYRHQIDVWRTDPVAFAYEAMSVDYLTNQQEKFLRDLADFVYVNTIEQNAEEIEAILFSTSDNPVKKKRDAARLARLTANIDGMVVHEHMEKYIRSAGFAISAGRDVGKSCALAMGSWWFLVCFEKPQGYILSPTGQQAKAIMMAEISMWGNRKIENPDTGEYENAFIFHNLFDITSEAIRYKAAPLERFMEVKRLPANHSVEDQKAFLSGFHSQEQLILVDEAVIFDDFVFETLNATNSRPLNWLIAIFNPVRASSYAVRSVHGDKMGVYDARVWSCEDSDKPGMRKQIEQLEKEYGGKNNDLYRVNVQGLPPEEGEDAFISMSMLENATKAPPLFPKSPHVKIGHDVAGMGSDNAATVVAIGTDVKYMYIHQGKDEHYQAAFLLDLYDKFQPKEINIDTIGIGRAVYVLLKDKINCVRPIVVNKSPTKDAKRYANQRAQHYWKLRMMFKDQHISFNIVEGKGQLTQLKRELLATERTKDGDPNVIQMIKKRRSKRNLVVDPRTWLML